MTIINTELVLTTKITLIVRIAMLTQSILY
jgi:hypothetical protein